MNGKSILITGGTGSFGQAFVKFVLENYSPSRLVVLSRDEFKQWQMQTKFPTEKYPNLRFFIGDIRDKDRLRFAFDGIDYVVHAAALKHVPTLEYNPFEAVKTNVIGTQNIIEVAIQMGVKKVVALSTDKAVSPVNLYGATKLTMEKLLIAGNAYSGSKPTRFCVVRYGNVIASRGSVIELFEKLTKEGAKELPITDERMTRFWISLKEGVMLVIFALENCKGGELFVPKIPSVKVVDIAKAICPHCSFRIIGIRPGEKLHEVLISKDESRNAYILNKDGKSYFVLLPPNEKTQTLEKLSEEFEYSSDKNNWWIEKDELLDFLKKAREE
ncbi:MAG: UDP-N-acetylglucosamine 4,6-dehydratase (inverting) [Aquificaceae bacterium]|nr:UDP-N-acetylglucosamine 4,6-dehydratase (inverting) [Aquificaceae bacterium]MDW8237198.1 UDP-N-acetylglucosamine 4,6-dehydratase (inverting) [Aquificaceae bacterium]